MTSFSTLGLMSGTSMDGLDIAFTSFKLIDGKWSFYIEHCKTYSYNAVWVEKLSTANKISGNDLMLLDKELGHLFSKHVLSFINEFDIPKNSVDFIASHGHTVFHQPQNGFTTQIGCGEALSYEAGIAVINDFRTKNVLAGGQGAPLVPIGDKLLFEEYEACINIGGFSNISVNKENQEIFAFDISPGNLPLNTFAQKLGYEFDANGDLARSGRINGELLSDLNTLEYYSIPHPKSLGTEWLESTFNSILAKDIDPIDTLRTLCEHIAIQISDVLNRHTIKKAIITGGGAKNTFLTDLIRSKTETEIVIPEPKIIDFKEAMIFGFLGCLYQLKIPNTLASVTGSKEDIIGGVFHIP